MRASIPALFTTLLLGTPVRAQITAGEVPVGTNAINVDIDLSLTTPNTTDSAPFSVDCDDALDIMAVLIHGQPAVDSPNSCALQLLNPGMALCADLSPFNWRPNYYPLGEVLECSNDFDWRSDEVTVLGDFGSFNTIGPVSKDSIYVAYRNGTLSGWILLSFDLLGDDIQLQIHQVLQPCSSTSIATNALASPLVLFPNPSNGQAIYLESPDALRSIEVLDPIGRIIARYSGPVRTIAAPEAAGTYLVRAVHADGRGSIAWLIRL